MSPSLLSTKLFRCLDLATFDLSPRGAEWFARALCWLASNCNVLLSPKFSQHIISDFFLPRGLRTFAPQRTANVYCET